MYHARPQVVSPLLSTLPCPKAQPKTLPAAGNTDSVTPLLICAHGQAQQRARAPPRASLADEAPDSGQAKAAVARMSPNSLSHRDAQGWGWGAHGAPSSWPAGGQRALRPPAAAALTSVRSPTQGQGPRHDHPGSPKSTAAWASALDLKETRARAGACGQAWTRPSISRSPSGHRHLQVSSFPTSYGQNKCRGL